MKTSTLTAALGAALVLTPLGARACQVDHFNFVWGSDAATHMATKPAESCRFGFHPRSSGHMASVQISQQPQHGTLTSADATHWMYRSRPGYTGPDTVIVKTSGDHQGNRRSTSGETNISYDITVAP